MARLISAYDHSRRFGSRANAWVSPPTQARSRGMVWNVNRNERAVMRPTRDEIAAAAGRTIPDLGGPGLGVLFAGINPSLYSAATGHHFARPGNRFWPALHRSGFTPRQLHPSQQALLLSFGLGVTNVVARASATAAEL